MESMDRNESVVLALSGAIAGTTLFIALDLMIKRGIDANYSTIISFIVCLLSVIVSVFTIYVFFKENKQMFKFSLFGTIGLAIVWFVCLIVYFTSKTNEFWEAVQKGYWYYKSEWVSNAILLIGLSLGSTAFHWFAGALPM